MTPNCLLLYTQLMSRPDKAYNPGSRARGISTRIIDILLLPPDYLVKTLDEICASGGATDGVLNILVALRV